MRADGPSTRTSVPSPLSLTALKPSGHALSQSANACGLTAGIGADAPLHRSAGGAGCQATSATDPQGVSSSCRLTRCPSARRRDASDAAAATNGPTGALDRAPLARCKREWTPADGPGAVAHQIQIVRLFRRMDSYRTLWIRLHPVRGSRCRSDGCRPSPQWQKALRMRHPLPQTSLRLFGAAHDERDRCSNSGFESGRLRPPR